MADLSARVAAFSQWHYEFDLDGVTTPIFERSHVNRHRERARYFFDPMVDLLGGSLQGKRVLDLGCNAGFWSLKAIEAGCDYVLGIDGRQMHVDQANLVFDVKMVEPTRFHFRLGNVFTDDFSGEGPFDVVLCLGLLYHVRKPVELIEKIAAVNTDILLIDTELWNVASSAWRVRHESLTEPYQSADHAMVLIPSRRAVIELTRSFGYAVVPLRLNASSYSGMRGYYRGKRLAFICAKQTGLSRLREAPMDEPFARFETATREAFRMARAGASVVRLTSRAVLARWTTPGS